MKPKFEIRCVLDAEFNPINGMLNYPETTSMRRYYKAEEVDAYIDKLFRDAVVVHGNMGDSCYAWHRNKPNDHDTHQALLIQIESLASAVCEHVPQPLYADIKLNKDGHTAVTYGKEWSCAACGKKLKANWEVCE